LLNNLSSGLHAFNNQSRLVKRLTIATLLVIDSWMGIRYGYASLNLLDYLVGGGIPGDMVWLLQTVIAISGAFFFIKILFDDVPVSWGRTIGIACSPLFLLVMIWLTLNILLKGQSSDAKITLDLVSISVGTLTWSSTYLAIAVGLTLTYKVQRYGNFAQSEFFMIGMYLAMIMVWSDHFFPLVDYPTDGVIVWSLLLWTILAAFILTGVAGILIDRLVYRGFRKKDASPQVMMIASLGVALILRAIVYLRFGAGKKLFEPDADWRIPSLRWDLPTYKFSTNLGVTELRPSEDANGNGEFDTDIYTQAQADAGEIPVGSQVGDIIPGTGEDLDGDGRFDSNPESYTHGTCEQSRTYTQAHEDAGEIPDGSQVGDIIPSDSLAYGTGSPAETYTDVHLDSDLIPDGSMVGDLIPSDSLAYGTGEPVYQRMVSSGWSPDTVDGSKPMFEVYDMASNCIDHATTGYAYYKGAMPVVIFSAVFLLLILLTKTRLGRRMRAVADNPDLAASSGINVERVHMMSAFLSAGLSGIGGAIFAMTVRYTPETAFSLLLPSFAVIVLGTIGSIPGAIVGSLIIGFVRALSSPVLIGIGLPLGRSNYTALDGVMPYIFLIAILMIMPEGIGDAYEKWKVDRLRKRAEEDSEPSKQVGAALAILPTGALGLHNLQQRKGSRGQSMMIVTIGSYVFMRLARFIGVNSYADGSCSETCETYGNETNLELLTGRTDGTFTLADAPFTNSTSTWKRDTFPEAPDPPSDIDPSLHDSWTSEYIAPYIENANQVWFDLMSNEITLVNTISDLGDVVWPLIPILIWLIAMIEGIYLLQGRDDDPLRPAIEKFNDISSSFSSLNLNPTTNSITNLLSTIPQFIAEKTIHPLRDSMKSNEISLNPFKKIAPYGRESPKGSWILFGFLMFVLILFLAWLPVAEQDGMRFIKVLQVSNVLITLSIFALMAFSLNLHTGVTGMVNFGVIFFVGVGSIVVGILCAPKDLHGYGWSVIPATIVAIIISSLFGWLLAYPTARLRMDYFAIVTISLGEIVRVLLAGEPLLRAGSHGSSIGISRYTLPGESWWFCGSTVPNKRLMGADWTLGTADDIIEKMEPGDCKDVFDIGSPAELLGRSDGNYTNVEILNRTTMEPEMGDIVYEASMFSMNLGEPAPYLLLLAFIGIVGMILVWWMLDVILASPWGRILRAIREDEEVAQHHGHDVLTHKAASLALGAGIAAFAGALWAWKLTGFQPNHMMPARSTFLVWAAFIVGGRANNRGMVVGAFIIVLMEFVFNVLVAGQGSADLPLHTTASHIDSLFEWLVTESWEVANIFIGIFIIGWLFSNDSLKEIGLSGVVTFTFCAIMMGQRTIDEAFVVTGIQADMAYVKVMLIGCLILFSLKYNPKGLLPEVPSRPERPEGGGTDE